MCTRIYSGGRGINRQAGLALAILFLIAGAVPRGHSQAASGGGAAAGDEAGLWRLWVRQNTPPLAYADLAKAWLGFAAGRPAEDPHVPVAHTLAAWNLLKADRHDEAKALLEPYAEKEYADGTMRGAREIARGWLSCLDREVLVAALEAYRADRVQYPERLADLEQWPKLPVAPRPVFKDRWGRAWVYRLRQLRSMPTLRGQSYSLTCRALGDASALEVALELTYAEGIALRPVQVRSVAGLPPMLTLASADPSVPPAMIQLDTMQQGIGVASISPSLVILYDRLHWKIFPTPKP